MHYAARNGRQEDSRTKPTKRKTWINCRCCAAVQVKLMSQLMSITVLTNMLTYYNMCWKKERSKVTVTFDELCVISFRWIKSTMCKSRSPRGNCFSLPAIETQGVNLHCYMGPLSWGFSKLPWVYTETQTHEISLNITKFHIGRFPKRFPRSWQFLLVFSSFFVFRSSFVLRSFFVPLPDLPMASDAARWPWRQSAGRGQEVIEKPCRTSSFCDVSTSFNMFREQEKT